MSARTIGRRIAHAHPKIYVVGARMEKYAYWGKRLFCGEYEKAGKKIALAYLKYGNIVADEKPDESRYAYCIAIKYAPLTWRMRLEKKKDSVFERLGPLE